MGYKLTKWRKEVIDVGEIDAQYEGLHLTITNKIALKPTLQIIAWNETFKTQEVEVIGGVPVIDSDLCDALLAQIICETDATDDDNNPVSVTDLLDTLDPVTKFVLMVRSRTFLNDRGKLNQPDTESSSPDSQPVPEVINLDTQRKKKRSSAFTVPVTDQSQESPSGHGDDVS